MTFGVVLTSRNDGYGDNLEHRTLLSIQNFIDRYDEVVYVDWNSPGGVSLIDLLKNRLKFKGNFKSIKVTENDLKTINVNLLNIAFIEVISRNIGIRRTLSDFILSSNTDIIADRPPDTLENNILYTSARRNIPEGYHQSKTDAIALRDNLIFNLQSFEKAPDSVDVLGNAIWDPGDNFSLVVCCGDFMLAHRDVWNKIRGFEEDMIYRGYADSNLMRKGQIYFLNKKLNVPVFHLNHTSNSMAVRQMNDQKQYGPDFKATNNKDSWGFPSYNFYSEVL